MELLDSLIFVLVVGAFVVGFPVLLLAQTIIAFGWGAIPLIALSVGAGAVSYTHLTLPTNREV